MDLNQLRYFCTLAKYENMTRASKELFITQPNLSTSLSRLEKELGVQLFIRRKGQISLAPGGKIFLEHVERAIRELEIGSVRARAVVSRERRRLTVVTSNQYIMRDVIEHFYSAFPDISVNQISCTNKELALRVIEGVADMGIQFGRPSNPLLKFIPISQSERVLMVSDTHPLAGRLTVSPSELTEYGLLCNAQRDDTQFLQNLSLIIRGNFNILGECNEPIVEYNTILHDDVAVFVSLDHYKKLCLTHDKPGIRALRLTGLPEEMKYLELGAIRLADIDSGEIIDHFAKLISQFLLSHSRHFDSQFNSGTI